jgi:hypothetical protein
MPCRAADDCILKSCISTDGRVPGGCQRYPTQVGCFARVERGAVQPEICVD